MSTRYPGGVINTNFLEPTAASASGNWNLSQIADAVSNSLWPIGYTISRSVRLRSSASAYFSKAAYGLNGATITWAGWVKRGTLGVQNQIIFTSTDRGDYYDWFGFTSNNELNYTHRYANVDASFTTSAVFRDPSAWYHIVVAVDSTQASNANRVKIFVNGVQQTVATSGTFTQSQAVRVFGGNSATSIGGSSAFITSNYFDGYMAEQFVIDGQALTPSSFGETDSVTGVWKPKKYSGTYGTNGFYLNFSDNSNNTAATIGKDYSGNGNNWTPNNISVTAGATYDSMLDVPTLWADGGNGRGNYAVLNPLDRNGTYGSVIDGNLTQSVSTANHAVVFNSMAMPSGKTYLEVTSGTTTSATPLLIAFGLATQSASRTGYGNTNTWSIKCLDVRTLWNGGSSSSNFGGVFTSGTTLQLAYDSSTGYMWIGDGTNWYNSTGGTTGNPSAGTNPSFTISTTEALFFFMDCYAGSGTVTAYANFGQRPFSYTPPSGFVALNTQNLPAPTISNGALYMAATTYTGTSATNNLSNSVNGVSFKPDFVWMKNRTNALSHYLNDSVRGPYKTLFSNLTNAEYDGTSFSDGVSTFNSNGFTLLNGTNAANYNQSANNYVAWQWQAGAGTTSSNTSGSITSTVSVNATAGFSVVAYNSGASGDKTVGHGLGVAPSMIITKSRSSASYNWSIYHASVATTVKKYLAFTTDALQDNGSNIWGSAFPTSSVFGITSGNGVVASTDCIAYCWAAVPGYSAFGSYTGNGSSDGPFVFTGFRPRWLLLKVSSAAGFDWLVYDSSRNTYNITDLNLRPNLSDAEGSQSANYLDFLSNGFKIRGDSTGSINPAQTIIYAAFAENPFKYSLAR